MIDMEPRRTSTETLIEPTSPAAIDFTRVRTLAPLAYHRVGRIE